MTPAELSRTVLHAVCRAVEEGALRVPVPESVSVERSRPGGRGDYATNVALRLAKAAGQPPREVAEILRPRVGGAPGISRVDITGPGFLSITLHDRAQQELVREVHRLGEAYGHSDQLRGTTFVLPAADETDAPAAAESDATGAPAAADGTDGTDELRTRIWLSALDRILRSQGALPGHGAPEDLHLVPSPDQGLLHSLGSDATRWALLRSAAHDRPDPGPHLLLQHERNPLFRVQYARDRARALSRNARDLGFHAAPEVTVDAPDLTAALRDHPAVLSCAARLRAPDRLARQLELTADALLAFQHTVLPLGDEKPSAAHRSRLALAEAAGTVLAGGLSLLGIRAPEDI